MANPVRHWFTGPRWRVRRAAYGSFLLVTAFYLLSMVYTAHFELPLLRAYLYGIIVLFEGVGALNIRRTYTYGSSYQIEKGFGAVGFMGLAASNAIGLTGSNFSLTVWFAVVIGIKLLTFEWIVGRNTAFEGDGGSLRTAMGRISAPRDREEVTTFASTTAAFARHGFLTDEDRVELMDALNAPLVGQWARDTAQRMRRRRERVADLQSAGIDVEASDLDPENEEAWPPVPHRG